MYPTNHDLPVENRERVATILQTALYEALELKLRVKEAHWTVRGPNFSELHALFDKIASDADDYADDFAERSIALGFPVKGKAADIAGAVSLLPPFAPATHQGPDVLRAVIATVAKFAKNVRFAIEATASEKDAGTSDLFTGTSRSVDKWLWMLEAHTG
jgi:starvation-inducible DNA-binding protein